MQRIRRLLHLFVLVALPTALAQVATLESLAPAETILALGLQGGEIPEADLEDAFASLDVEAARDAFEQIMNALATSDVSIDVDAPLEVTPFGALGDEALGELGSELDAECPGIGTLTTDLLESDWAEDLLLAVAADRFSPLPAVLALARVNEAAVPAAEALGAQLRSCFGGDVVGSEAGSDMVILFDGSDLPLVVAQRGTLFLIGSRPDVVRSALRREAGASEASLADHPAANLPGEGPGARLYWNAAGIADVLEALLPLPPEDPTRAAVDRGSAVLRTLGVGGARVTLDADGATVEGVFQPNPDGGDPTFYDLATCNGCDLPVPNALPNGTVAASASTLRAAAWLDWLDELGSDLGAILGAPITVRGLAQDFLGIDLDATLAGWLGGDVLTTRLAPFSGDVDGLLFGAPQVTSIAVTDEAAARAGIATIREQLPALLRAFDVDEMIADAGLGGDAAVTRDVTIAGIDALRVQAGPTLDLAIAVHAGRLWIASPSRALALVTDASYDATASDAWQALNAAPGSRIGWSLSNPRDDLLGAADLLDVTAQPLASLLQVGITAALEESTDPFNDFGGGSFGGFDEPYLNDLAFATPYPGPEGLLDQPRSELTLDGVASGNLGSSGRPGSNDLEDVWTLPTIPDGTEASLIVESNAFDTYLYLYDAVTGEELAYNDDQPDTTRSEIRFLSDGRELLAGVTSFMGDETGPYTLEFRLAGSAGAPATRTDDASSSEPVEVPSFATLLDATEFLPGAVRVIAERVGDSWGVVTSEDGVIRHTRRFTFDW